MSDELVKASEEYKAKKESIKPYNVRDGYNLFLMDTDSVRDLNYGNLTYKNVITKCHYCEDLVGKEQPGEATVSLSENLFQRISYYTVMRFGMDMPKWVGVIAFRYLVKKQWNVRFRYNIGILSEKEFMKIYGLYKRNGDNNLLIVNMIPIEES